MEMSKEELELKLKNSPNLINNEQIDINRVSNINVGSNLISNELINVMENKTNDRFSVKDNILFEEDDDKLFNGESQISILCNDIIMEEKNGRSASFLKLRRAINRSRNLINKIDSDGELELTGADFEAIMRLSEAAQNYADAHKDKKRGVAGARKQRAQDICNILKAKMNLVVQNKGNAKKDQVKDVSEKDISDAKHNVKRISEYYFKMSERIGDDLTTTDIEKLSKRWNILKSCERDILICDVHRDKESLPSSIRDIIEQYNLVRSMVLFARQAKQENPERDVFKNKGTATIKKTVKDAMPELKDELADNEQEDNLTSQQIAGISKIDTWVVRNFSNSGLSGIIGAKADRFDIANRLLSMPRRKRLFIYYLVEKDARKTSSLEHFGTSQMPDYVPNVTQFKDRMIPTWVKFYKRFDGSYIYWDKLREAMGIADRCNGLIKAAIEASKEISQEKTDKEVNLEEKDNKIENKIEEENKILKEGIKNEADAETLRQNQRTRITDLLNNILYVKQVLIAQEKEKDKDNWLNEEDDEKINGLKVKISEGMRAIIAENDILEKYESTPFKHEPDVRTFTQGIPKQVSDAGTVGVLAVGSIFNSETLDKVLKAIDNGAKGIGLLSSFAGLLFAGKTVLTANSLSWVDYSNTVVGMGSMLASGLKTGTAAAAYFFDLSKETVEKYGGATVGNVIAGFSVADAGFKLVSAGRDKYYRSKAKSTTNGDDYQQNLIKLLERTSNAQTYSTVKAIAMAGVVVGLTVLAPELLPIYGAVMIGANLAEGGFRSNRSKSKRYQIVDDFFKVKSAVANVKKNMGMGKLSKSEEEKLETQVRKRLCAEAGFLSVRDAAYGIAGRYAQYLIQGAHQEGKDGESYRSIIQGFGLYYRHDKHNSSKNRPIPSDLVKKMCNW